LAKTGKGRKIVHVKPYVRVNEDGTKTKVPEHYRSTPE
jgi:hypothetical protein